MRLMKSDLLPFLVASIEQDLESVPRPEFFADRYAACLVLAAEGYPEKPRKGMLIEGIEAAGKDTVQILHAATERRGGQSLYRRRQGPKCGSRRGFN